MKLSELFSNREEFASETEIAEYIEKSKNFDPDKESVRQADALLIFSTSKQHTWLVATGERLYCILDDLRRSEPHINWAMPKSALIAGDRLLVDIRTRPYSENTGLLDIDDKHRNWLYTKRLFSDYPIERRIAEFIERKMRP